ncbi:MAG: heme-copper oxidase subunit III [Candidatus Marinimicrobia bacterium]|nr:heme-copper oxidase subunit III [Candidatus Neomarinimicrobiota bacterium]MBT4154943.1 heme-copper oxidase subunit III [Candidatus Neomarinimicrobiota bacterium]MBT6129930.1 heme-copper oxidase subunit III [Candidatus Neomarinimicrobiota bacterium]MBT6712193.1 heme-copper oxidase subunit III [Candidatus Neomarinimicrobiota bacterium]MBT7514593.1 heme-copper oxidase subunit III [Candidatus Neomarinimicrobiota bacterium]
MQIPYTTEERPDTGLNNSKLGIWIFLASEIMLFGGLFSAYVFLRMAAPDGDFAYWGSKLNIPMATFNTLVLITSSMTMLMSWASLKMKDLQKFKMYMGLTLLCATIFLVVKYFEYTGKFHHGIFPSSSTFMGIYFTLTGLHMLHIIGGMIVMGYFWLPMGNKMWESDSERFTNRIEIVGLYWHFVDLVWIFLFPILYLL